jgi:hypothetical protein
MAIQSAWLLCRRLARERDALLAGADQGAVARAYARDWQRNFAGRVRVAAVLGHLAMRPHRARALLPLLRAAPGLLTVAARFGGKTRALDRRAASAAARTMVASAPRLGG